MKNLLYTSLVLGLFIFASCTKISRKTEVVKIMKYDSVSIALDYPYLGFYYGSSSIYVKNNDVFWAGYNHLAHSIDVVNLTKQHVVESIALESEGPDAIPYNNVGSFVFNDSLIVFKDFSTTLKLFSRKQKAICGKIRLFEAEENWTLNYVGVLPGQFGNSFSMKMYDGMLVQPVYSKTRPSMKDVLLTSINLKNNEVKRLDISYPEDMCDDIGNYGSLTYPCLTMSDDRIVYNFPYSSRVYSYMLDGGDAEVLFMESGMTDNRSELKPDMELRDVRRNLDYETMSLRFCETYYDKVSDSYIRVHHNRKIDFDDKEESYLMIHDCKTKRTMEYGLPSCFSTRYYVANGHVYFLLDNNLDDYLYFAAIDIRMNIIGDIEGK